MQADDSEAYWDNQVWQIWKDSGEPSSWKAMTETKDLFESQPKELQRLIVGLIGAADKHKALSGTKAKAISGTIIVVCLGLAWACWVRWQDPVLATFFGGQTLIVVLCHYMLYRGAVRRAVQLHAWVREAGFSNDDMLRLGKWVKIVLAVGFREEEREKRGVTF